VSGGLSGVGHQAAPVIQKLQDVAVGHAQSVLPAHLEAAGGLELLHLQPGDG